MDEMVELRCKYCGAPLDRADVESDSPYVTCPSCGTTQQRLDAKQYMDQMMAQIKSWIGKAIPGGFSMTQTENVDPIARHNIFVNNVKPMLDVELSEYRFALNSVVSSPLIVLPFSKGEPARSNHTSTHAFEFNAKLKSIEPLAVDPENRTSIVDGENLSSAYALIVNNSKLLTDTTPGRFALMANNFREAAESVSRCEGYGPLASRLEALAEVCSASDMVLNGDTLGCSAKAESAISKLEAAKQDILKSPRLAVMIRAVDLELSQCRTLKNVAEMVMNGTTKDPLKTLDLVNRLSSVDYPQSPAWDRLLGRQERDFELYRYVEAIVSAKNGGTLPICPGSGDVLMPFWDVDLKYSFTTGSFFSKKAVEVKEDLMVPAVFTVSAEALGNPRSGLTDIFSAAPENSILDRMRGDEDSISGGAGIGRLADSASENSPGSRHVVVPLSTRTEATRLVECYLDQCARTHSKLKLSKPMVKGLIYVPCSKGPQGVSLPKEFGGLEPRILRTMDLDGALRI